MRKPLLALLAAGLLTTTFGTIYVIAQQSLRQGANEPQIGLAEDTAVKLNSGLKPADVVGAPVDIGQSLSPAVIVYDIAGKPLASSAELDGQPPVIPFGVLQASTGHEYHTVTWQPRKDVRLASATVPTKNGYVTAVRSLREVEKLETHVMLLALFGWSISMTGLGAVLLVVDSPKRHRG